MVDGDLHKIFDPVARMTGAGLRAGLTAGLAAYQGGAAGLALTGGVAGLEGGVMAFVMAGVTQAAIVALFISFTGETLEYYATAITYRMVDSIAGAHHANCDRNFR